MLTRLSSEASADWLKTFQWGQRPDYRIRAPTGREYETTVEFKIKDTEIGVHARKNRNRSQKRGPVWF
jgi:hypothetical protein